MTLSGLIIICLSVVFPVITSFACRNIIHCPCGNSNTTIKFCLPQPYVNVSICNRWSHCSKCRNNLNRCLKCPDGFSGDLCNQGHTIRKRQNYYGMGGRQNYHYERQYGSSNGLNKSFLETYGSSCPALASPGNGGFQCNVSIHVSSCTAKCLPGYAFEGQDSDEKMTLTCSGNSWLPYDSFPACKSRGYCDLINQGSAAYNCSIDMNGKRCYVWCDGSYAGEYTCYPGRSWIPSLPYCVREKAPTVEKKSSCNCEHGRCDTAGHCICPAGRTGRRCESVVPEKVTCPDPGFITNGVRKNSDNSISSTRRTFQEGEIVRYSCSSSNFVLQGSKILLCEDTGRWSDSAPRCTRPTVAPEVTCPDPGQAANGNRFNSDGSPSVEAPRHKVGKSLVYSCHFGFSLQAHRAITCTSSGAWSDIKPVCERNVVPDFLISTTTEQPRISYTYCRDPGTDPNAVRIPGRPPSSRGFQQGTPVRYTCVDGYNLEGVGEIFCLPSGQWSSPPPTCSEQFPSPGRVSCVNQGPIENGERTLASRRVGRWREQRRRSLDDLEFPEGTLLRYSCYPGFRLEGSSSITCQPSGSWSEMQPTCERTIGGSQFCTNPGRIENGGIVDISGFNQRRAPQSFLEDLQFSQGSRLQYSCDFGHILSGSSVITCTTSGLWSPSVPKCNREKPQIEPEFCRDPGNITNGKIYRLMNINDRIVPRRIDGPVNFPIGTRLEYSCDEDYELEGVFYLVCEKSGEWSALPPQCISKCGHSYVQFTHRVVNGTKSEAGEWPWVVALSVYSGRVASLVCGGVLINPNTVLTAAHCIVAETLSLSFGKIFVNDELNGVEVHFRNSIEIIKHPKYNSSNFDSDIALIKFFPSIRYTKRIQPICLPTADSTANNLMTGSKGFVTGFGIEEKNVQAEELRHVEIPVISTEDCVESYRSQGFEIRVTGNMFCAGLPEGQRGVCRGDSGSPIVFFDKEKNRYYAEGLVSFTTIGQCALPGRYTIFTEIYKFRPWIRNNML